MNKAFIREADDVPSRCPRCGGLGQPVGDETLTAQLPPQARQQFVQTAAFCPNVQCPVVYFDDFGATVTREVFGRPIPVKDADAPLCSCFGITRDDIETDVEEGVVTRTRAAVLQAQSEAARCRTKAPNGASCLSAVQGYYMQCRNAHDAR